MSRRSLVACAVSAALMGGFATNANASAFALIEQGVKGLGNAYAGGAAVADDASTVFYNPAGMTRLKDGQFAIGAHLIKPSAKFSNSGSHISSAIPALLGGGAPLTGGDGGDAGSLAFVPNFYYVQDIGNGMRFGLGVNAPFGLTTEYDSGWVGRYQAMKSEIKTINVNPSFAIKTNDQWSFGFGLNAQYMEATLTQDIDYSVACIGTIGAACVVAGLGTPQNSNTDGSASNKADDIAWGFNVGALFEVDPDMRFGFAYRSKVKHELEGKADFTVPAVVAAGASVPAATLRTVFSDTDVIAKVTLPETLSLSGYFKLNEQWSLLADATRTRWSRIPELRIEFDNTAKDDSFETLNWKDTWRYAVGASFVQDDTLTWRMGVAYDQSPIPDAEHTTARLPDNDRKWLAFGGTYQPSKSMAIDFGYAHLFVSDTEVNRVGALGDTLKGTYKNTVDILSAQLNWTF